MAKKQKNASYPTISQSEDFDMLSPILDSVFRETKELSTKKQDGVLNELKIKMINRILAKMKTILKNDPTIEFLDLLDEETLPINSDAVFVIAQFEAAMKQFKEKYYDRISGWNTSD